MPPASRTPSEAWRLQVLKLLQANPSLSQRQLAAEMGVSLGKANYCPRALVKQVLVSSGSASARRQNPPSPRGAPPQLRMGSNAITPLSSPGLS